MTKEWIKWVGLALFCAALSVAPARAAVTWTIVTNNDCTALGTATGLTTAQVNCCQGAKIGFCDYRDTFGGTSFVRVAYVAATGTSTYTTTGDALAASELAKLQMGTIIYADCNPAVATGAPATALSIPTLVRTATGGKIQLFNPTNIVVGALSTATTANNSILKDTGAVLGVSGTGTAFTQLANAAEVASGATVTNTVVNCLVIGR